MQNVYVILVIIDMPTLLTPSLSRKYAPSWGDCSVLAAGMSSRQRVAKAKWQKQLTFWKVSFRHDKYWDKIEETVY